MSISNHILEEVSEILSEVVTEPLKIMAKEIESQCYYNQSRVFLIGNGGSSATMSHLASDLMNLGIFAMCLTDNVPALTAKVNDEGWETVYNNLIEEQLKAGDFLIIASVNGSSGLSPDGEDWSSNLLNIAKHAQREKCCYVYAFTGNDGGDLKDYCDAGIYISSKNPYVVEGVHSVLAHALVAEIKKIKEEEE